MSSNTFYVRVTFFEPFRVTDWVANEKQKSDKYYLRGLSFARRQNGKLLITGTLLRSALLKEVEYLLAVENKYDCCPGQFVTKKKNKNGLIPLLRRRPTYKFSQKKEPCPETDPCPFCLLLGRFDKKYKQNEKIEYSLRFSNLYTSTNGKDSKERILNRVDFSSGKAKDYFRIQEVDHRICSAFSGKIVIRDDLDRQEEVENLLAAGLARIKTLCGALCSVDIVENGSIQRHQDLIARYFDPNIILPLPTQVVDYEEYIESTNTFSAEEPLLPNSEKIKKLAENIAKSLKAANKKPHQRRMADAVRDLRRFSHEKLQQLPEKTKGGSTTLWAVSSKGSKSPKKLICEFVDAEKITRDSWRKFCEKLGEAIYNEEKNRQKKAVALPRLLGDTEYYGRPSVIDPGIEYSDPKTLPAYEWIMVGTLKAETPFYFGVESESAQTSAAILLTSDGSYRLPRSVLRGALRRELRDVAGSGCNVELGSSVPCPCDVCQIMRCLTVMDSMSNYQEPPEIRHRIRMNQHSGIVDEGALFDSESGPEGLTFPFRLYLRTLTEHLDQILREALERWRNGMAFLGGDSGTGKGRFVLNNDLKLFFFHVKDPEDLKMIMDHRYFVNEDVPEIEKSAASLSIVPLSWEDVSCQVLPPWQKYKYEITLESPVLTNDPIAAMLKDKHADTTPVQKRVLEEDGRGGFKEKDPAPYFIKGEGIRGILRTAVGRNNVNKDKIPLHSLPHDDCDCILCALFGSEHHQGMLRFEDAHFETDPAPKTLDHVAIDRFTGGARDKFKFDDSPLIATPDKPLKLTGTFWLHRDLHEAFQQLLSSNSAQRSENNVHETAKEQKTREAVPALREAFADVNKGMFPIGGNGGIGYGWVSKLTVTDPGGKEVNLDTVAGLSEEFNQAKGTYTPPGDCDLEKRLADQKNVFYPHYFLRPHNYIDRENRPVTHETYHVNKLTGKISCRLKAKGPLFIPDPASDKALHVPIDLSKTGLEAFFTKEEYDSLVKGSNALDTQLKGVSYEKEDRICIPLQKIPNKQTLSEEVIHELVKHTEHKSYRFFRLNGKVMIPGSEIRGMVSSVYEALTNSCFRVLDEKQILFKRMEAKPEILNEFNPGRINADGNIIKMKSYRLPLYDSENITAQIKNTYKGEILDSDAKLAKYAKINRDFLTNLLKTENNDVLSGKKKVSFYIVKINNVDNIAVLKIKGKQTGFLKITGPNAAKIQKSSGNKLSKLDSSWEMEELNVLHNSFEERPGKKHTYKRPTLECSDGIYDYNMDKRCERIFVNLEGAEESFSIPPKVKADYLAILADYSKNTKNIPKVFQTRLPSEENALKKGELVYFRHEKGIATHIIPVEISRKAYGGRMGNRFNDGFHDLRPCTFECLDNCDGCPDRCEELKEFFNPHPKGLCPACHLFGSTSYKSRVSFGFARLARADQKAKWYGGEETEEGKPLTLPLLERPRPTWSMPDADSTIPGRKFYVHHPHSVNALKKDEGVTKNNRTIEPLDVGNDFTFEVRFTNIEEYELGLLLYALQLEKGLAHKLGMGKALGFGSVEIMVEKVEVRNAPGEWNDKMADEISGWLNERKKKLEGWFKKDYDEIEHIADLKKLLYFGGEDVKPKVRYPSLSIEDDKADHFPGYVDLKRKPSSEKSNRHHVPETNRRKVLTTPWATWYVIPESDMGTVKWFNHQKKYGFISRDNGEDIFVHQNGIDGNGVATLIEGQKVTFEIGQGQKGPQAINVKVVS